MTVKVHINGSWTGPNSGGGGIPVFAVALDAPGPDAILKGNASFVANPHRVGDNTPTAEFNSYVTSAELWRGTPESPTAKLGDMLVSGYGYTYVFNTLSLADSTYNFHAKFTLTDASVLRTNALFLPIDNVTDPPPVQGDTHSTIRSKLWTGTNVDVTTMEAAWGDPILGSKKFRGGRTWSEWVTNIKSEIDDLVPAGEGRARYLCPTLGPQNETLINSITGTSNPTIVTAQSMEIQTGDTIVLSGVKTGSQTSSLNGRKAIEVVRNSATSFTLQGVTFEGNYNTSDKGQAMAGWGQIEGAAGRFDTYLRQIRDHLHTKLGGYSSTRRTNWFANNVWNPCHEYNGGWYIQANNGDKTYDGRSGAWSAFRSFWRRYYRILMYEAVGFAGTVPTTAQTNSLVDKYGARCMKWGMETANFDVATASSWEPWPGDEYVDIIGMNMYCLTYGGQSSNVWDGTSKSLIASTTNSVTRRGVALGILPASYLTDGKGDCQKRALEFLAAFARNTNNCRRQYPGGTGDTRTLLVAVGEWSPVALKQTFTYTSDTVPKQQISGLYDWCVANADLLHHVTLFDIDKTEGYFACLRVQIARGGSTHGLPADGSYKSHTGINTARSTTANRASHRPSVSNQFLDVFGRR